jgi:hypothetical protein
MERKLFDSLGGISLLFRLISGNVAVQGRPIKDTELIRKLWVGSPRRRADLARSRGRLRTLACRLNDSLETENCLLRVRRPEPGQLQLADRRCDTAQQPAKEDESPDIIAKLEEDDPPVTGPALGGQGKSKFDRAAEFLLENLRDGAVRYKVIKARAAQKGIKESTLRLARTNLGVISEREGSSPRSPWVLSLPGG